MDADGILRFGGFPGSDFGRVRQDGSGAAQLTG